ncbi:hypothetical protein CRG98_011326 [Punica granatum]|uniref:Uncharacterized protein n=1 Tax=Punica granatum TaxID=22663 RepID=A0A2I0KKI4_PUNGR|nr:hypothetical protein CRG98_011326 [Punica granatum]
MSDDPRPDAKGIKRTKTGIARQTQMFHLHSEEGQNPGRHSSGEREREQGEKPSKEKGGGRVGRWGKKKTEDKPAIG